MGDIVYWDSGEYDTNRDVISATIEPTPGGILVNWGGGDTDTLTGDFWDLVSIYSDPILVGGQCISTYTYKVEIECIHLNGTFWAINNNGSFIGRITSFYPEVLSNNNRASILRYVRHTGEIRSVNVPWSSSLGRIVGFGQVILTYLSGDLSCGNLGGGDVIAYKVTSNTGQISQRNTTTPPTVSLLTAGCRIKITYPDNSIEYIPFSSCPPWVAVRSDDQCPDGTCRQDCGDHYCCFDLCTGAAVKKIPK